MKRTLVLFMALVGCGPSSGRRAGGEGGGGGGGGEGGGAGGGPVDNGGQGCAKIDFLFVIDDSHSMAQEQSNLAANFPKVIDVINQYRTKGGAALDYRLGVVTTGKTMNFTLWASPTSETLSTQHGKDGHLQQTCGMTRRFIERNDSDVSQQFACLAEVGTSGPSWEMPLDAGIRMPLADRIADGSNAGFLRDDALLAVVILADEDDCSIKSNQAIYLQQRTG